MADSYIIRYKTGNIQETRNTSCFSQFNSSVDRDKGNKLIEEAVIIIEKNKVQHLQKDYILNYLNYCLKLGVIQYEIIEKEDEYYLKLNLDDIKNKSHLQYTGMIVRCLYEPRQEDNFQLICKHFMNMCKFFPSRSKAILFTTACNIFITEMTIKNPNAFGYNSNHILMFSKGCKILRKKEIIELIDKNTGINGNFTTGISINKDDYKLQDETKSSYAKIIWKIMN